MTVARERLRVQSIGGIMLRAENRSTVGTNMTSATFSIEYPAWTDVDLRPDLHSLSHLSY